MESSKNDTIAEEMDSNRMRLFLSSSMINYRQYSAVNPHDSSPPPDSSISSASKLVLYSNWQSSCSWRVRFALNLKGLPYEYKAVDLAKGEHLTPEFEKLNPRHFVPVLVDGDFVVSDSYAILMYLEEKYPQNALLPVDLRLRALNLQSQERRAFMAVPYGDIRVAELSGLMALDDTDFCMHGVLYQRNCNVGACRLSFGSCLLSCKVVSFDTGSAK
ncbi:hypothetical protein Vadar_005033 [Vaccinium darrowii]|uniref:Uncharacterized protein n=1 Tax=Vaccinium darrowii TaxID=229202 RepID=A0ACB7ZA04_9ERIC|nr:hypothetical protein Vadar_005033 [Vaccinium darrowii]